MRCIVLVGLCWLGLAINAHADTLTNDAPGYSLDFPDGWTVVKKGPAFSAEHPDGSSFDGSRADLPASITSVEVAALMSRASALAAGLCGGQSSEFALSAADWVGRGFHCNNRPVQGKPPSEAIGFTVKRGEVFYQFFLSVPRQDWEAGRERYLSLFRSLRFESE